MGMPSTDSPSGGWGRDSRSLKTCDAMASIGLWTLKLTRSDDWIIRFASGTSGTSRVSDGDVLIWTGGSSRSCTRGEPDSACKRFNILSSAAYHRTHLFEAAIDNRLQSFPEFVYGLARYGPTLATPEKPAADIIPILNVVCHGNVEFEEMKQVRRISHVHDVLINPAWDSRRAELSTG